MRDTTGDGGDDLMILEWCMIHTLTEVAWIERRLDFW